jgi:general secretion pathway protein H
MVKAHSHRRSTGFTLIELLVVIAIVAVLAGMIGTSFIGGGQTQAMEGFALRMAQRMELARDRALQRNREWGLYIEEAGYQFAEFNEVTQTWDPYTQRPFNAEAYAKQVQMSAQVEEYQGQTDAEEDSLPEIILFSSGEVTPFTLTLKSTTVPELIWILDSDGFTRIKARRQGI